MKNIIELINDSFGGKYFESQIVHWVATENDQTCDSNYKHVYTANMYYTPTDSSVLRIKQYSDMEFSEENLDKFIDTFNEYIVRNALFSKPINKRSNFYKKYKDNIIKPFADYKKEILELKIIK